MRTFALALIFLFVAAIGCSRSRVVMDIAMKNETPKAINWVTVHWDGPRVPGGILPPGISKTAINVEPPKSDIAIIIFVEDDSRKPHTNRLDVSSLKRLAPGSYDVTLVIVSVDSAELRIRERKDR